MKILVVEDSKTMRHLIKQALQAAGYTKIIEAGNGRDAIIRLTLEKGVDIIFTAWNMPVKNGLELVTDLRSDPKYAHIPVIMLTTRGNKSDLVNAMRAGANDYIVKPFDHETIQKKLLKYSIREL